MSGGQYQDLISLLDGDQILLMDGALGTELERRGVPFEGCGWSAFAVRDHGSTITEVHGDYINVGAKLHIVNSFALGRHVLQPVGLAKEFEQLNRRSVELFDLAVSNSKQDRREFWVAGSLSTFSANSDRSALPKEEVLWKNYNDQARILFESGVDLFALEMLFDSEVTLLMLDAVQQFKLPVIIGITCDWLDSNGTRQVIGNALGMPPIELEQILNSILQSGITQNAILSIMHSEFDVTDAALEIVQRKWNGPIAIYPNSGEFINLQMQFDSVCSPTAFQTTAAKWIGSGVNIVGGCCGIGPSHIQALSSKLNIDI